MPVSLRLARGTCAGLTLLLALVGCKEKYTGKGLGARGSLAMYPGTRVSDVDMRFGLGAYYHWDSRTDRWEAALDFVPDWGELSNFYVAIRGDYLRLFKAFASGGIYAGGGAGAFFESETTGPGGHPAKMYPMAEVALGSILILGKKGQIPLDLRASFQFPFGAENVSFIISTSLGYEF